MGDMTEQKSYDLLAKMKKQSKKIGADLHGCE